MSPCRYCGAPVLWGITLLDRRMPLDPEPDITGNVAVRTVAGQIHCRVLGKTEPEAPDEVRHVPHFATCPNWGRHKERASA